MFGDTPVKRLAFAVLCALCLALAGCGGNVPCHVYRDHEGCK